MPISEPGKSSNNKVELLKKRPTKRPDWNDLMAEIEMYRNSHGLLKKVKCNDRSKPILTATKLGASVRGENKAEENI